MRIFKYLSAGLFYLVFLVAVSGLPAAGFAQRAEIGSLIIRDLDDRTVVLTEEQILALPRHQIQTSTAWTEGKHVFEGVFLGDLLAAAGIDYKAVQDKILQTEALNDYQIDVPVEDIAKYNPLVAAFMDGQRLSVRDKGPYWLVYPRDDYKDLQDLRYDHRWSWQLKELKVR
ncbi:molybdopterin-dependent oxidoreductase [Pseudochrobactrum sp. HB0163]|uniref:molybdopterin-dependent oxidoreductase n=1 Tax=Pseudochrobactrum sp. HB0163 TaxID=3450708 RepID=UPI003F6DD4F8